MNETKKLRKALIGETREKILETMKKLVQARVTGNDSAVGLAEDVRKMEFKLRRLQMNKNLSTFHKFQPVPKGSKPLLKSEIKEI